MNTPKASETIPLIDETKKMFFFKERRVLGDHTLSILLPARACLLERSTDVVCVISTSMLPNQISSFPALEFCPRNFPYYLIGGARQMGDIVLQVREVSNRSNKARNSLELIRVSGYVVRWCLSFSKDERVICRQRNLRCPT